MSIPVPIHQLREALEQRSNGAYLLTVGDDARPHCVAVVAEWHGDELRLAAGTGSVRNAAARRQVTLLVPPMPPAVLPGGSEPGPAAPHDGYSLIVDADVTDAVPSAGGGGTVQLRPTHAVLHRPAATPAWGPSHDCVPVYDRGTSPGDGTVGERT